MVKYRQKLRAGAGRSGLVLTILVLAAIAAWFLFSRNSIGLNGSEYNVVLITFDTTNASHLGCYGAKFAETPTLDQLAEQGIRYKNCFATNPITLPSHASILTGLYPIRHGIHDNGLGSLPGAVTTLPELLKANGYTTGAVIGAYPLNGVFGLSQGFDFYDDDIRDVERPSHMFLERNAGVVTKKAVDWLEQLDGKKYFFWAHYFDPHADYQPPGVFEVATTPAERFRFYNMEITYADRQLGKLLKKVREIEKATGRPTLLVITADHGESLGQHKELTHGIFMYNATMHVPLIIHDSRNLKQSETIDRPVSIIDIFPTLIERLGLNVEVEVDGLSLDRDPDGKRCIYMESVMGASAYGWSPLSGIVRGTEKFILAPRSEYYDIASDFDEKHNLFKFKAEAAEQLQEALEDLVETKLTLTVYKPAELKVDDAATRRLQSLGYISGGNREASAPVDPKDVVEVHFRILQAQEYISKKQYPNAVKLLKRALKQEPRNKLAIDTMSGLFARFPQLIKQTDGIAFFEELTQLAPKHGPIWFVLGVTHEQAGDRQSAQKYYVKSLDLDPANQTALNHAAWNAYKLEQDYEQALQWVNKAIRLGSNAHMLHTKACLLIELKRPGEAANILKTAISQKSNFPVAYYHLGVALQLLDRTEEAKLALSQAIAIGGKNDDWLKDAKQRLDSILVSTKN